MFQEPFAPPNTHGQPVPLLPSRSGGVPPERMLDVRDARNAVVATDFIMLYEATDLAPEPASKLFEACAARGVLFSPWMLAGRFTTHGGNAA